MLHVVDPAVVKLFQKPSGLRLRDVFVDLLFQVIVGVALLQLLPVLELRFLQLVQSLIDIVSQMALVLVRSQHVVYFVFQFGQELLGRDILVEHLLGVFVVVEVTGSESFIDDFGQFLDVFVHLFERDPKPDSPLLVVHGFDLVCDLLGKCIDVLFIQKEAALFGGVFGLLQVCL